MFIRFFEISSFTYIYVYIQCGILILYNAVRHSHLYHILRSHTFQCIQ